MAAIDLLDATGDPVVDAIIRDVVGSFEVAFPGRVLAYYLIGSYADGTAVATSDIDLKLVFRESLAAGDEEHRARQVAQQCAQRSAIGLDVAPFGEDDAQSFGDVDIKLAGRLLYGEDIRERMALPPIELWARVLMHELHRFIARARGNPAFVTFPLDYPDPAGEFYGYDRRRLRSRDGGAHDTTKDLVRITGGVVSALVAWRARQYVVRKSDCVAAYRATIDDEWTDLVAAIDQMCRVELGYLTPSDASRRQRLRALCAEALAFENHFLAQYRTFALGELTRPAEDDAWVSLKIAAYMLGCPPETVRERAAHGGLQSATRQGRPVIAARPCYRAWAARLLGHIVYPGDRAIEAALTAVADSDLAETRDAARESLQLLHTATR